MRKIEKSNRFAKELKEANRNGSFDDMKMLRELDLMMKQIKNIPNLPQTKPTTSEEEEYSHQPIPLRLLRQCFSQRG